MIKLKNILLTVTLFLFYINVVNGLKNVIWQELPLECNVCDGTECDNIKLKSEKCNENTDTCVTIFDVDNKVIKRGCFSKMKKNHKTNEIYQCRSNKCNVATSTDDYIKCYQCSSFDNSKCFDKIDKTTRMKTTDCYKNCMTTLIHTSEKKDTFEVVRGCLDDKEKADQIKCTGEACISCENDKCNEKRFPDDILSCYHCKNEKCQRPTRPDLCKPYKKNDKCMIEFDSKNVEIQYGCTSYLQDIELKEKKIDNQLFVCDGKQCNTKENLPTENNCKLCESDKDKSCITNVMNIKDNDFCKKSPNTNCYTKYDSKTGLIKRGCWANIKDRKERENCLDGENRLDCKMCDDENCNIQILPVDRNKCLTCDSDKDPNCHYKSSNAEYCFKYTKNDACITKYTNKTTLRGCQSDIGNCDGLDSFSCFSCAGENCNNIDLKSKVKDTNHGMWQDLPLKCKKCENVADCNKDDKTKTEICKNNNDECLTIFKNNKVTYRGCSSKLIKGEDKTYCDINPLLCPQCKSNECNIAKSKDEYVKCHYCGWPNSKECNDKIDNNNKIETRECYKSCMIAAYNKSEVGNEQVYNVIRSCLDDKEIEQQEICKKDDNGQCRACEGELCNNELLYKDWHMCYMCSGVEDCSKNAKPKLCQSYTKSEACYNLYDVQNKNIIQGGCLSTLTNEQKIMLLENNKVSFCFGKECNKDVTKDQKCLTCNSNKTEGCATEPNVLTESLDDCAMPNSNCFVKVDENGYTQRGCMNKLGKDILNCMNDDKKCNFCSGPECNKEIFPANRQKCYICDSENDEKCEKKPEKVKVCPIYDANLKCVSFYEKENKITKRDCSNTLNCDPKDEKLCQICEDANCNAKNLRELNSSAMILANSLLIGLAFLLREFSF